MTTKREELIPLASAHVNQYTDEKNGKSPWEVQENETNNLLAVLPRTISDGDMFKVLHFARKFELLAFNIGMSHMQKELFGHWDKEKENLLRVIKELKDANERLADKLGDLIGEEEE